MFAVTGKRTTIVRALEELTGEQAHKLDTKEMTQFGMVIDVRRFVLAGGVLGGSSWLEHGELSASVNLLQPIQICEQILAVVPDARICVVGSQSATLGSFDRFYAAGKAGLEAYVRTREVGSGQLLCAVSPTIIADSGMTIRRADYPRVLEQRHTVRAVDVARAIFELLWTPVPLESVRRVNQNRVVPVTTRLPP